MPNLPNFFLVLGLVGRVALFFYREREREGRKKYDCERLRFLSLLGGILHLGTVLTCSAYCNVSLDITSLEILQSTTSALDSCFVLNIKHLHFTRTFSLVFVLRKKL